MGFADICPIEVPGGPEANLTASLRDLGCFGDLPGVETPGFMPAPLSGAPGSRAKRCARDRAAPRARCYRPLRGLSGQLAWSRWDWLRAGRAKRRCPPPRPAC